MTAFSTFWSALNHRARQAYRALLTRHPALARGLKAALMPVLLAGNRAFLRRDYVSLFSAPVDHGLRGRFQADLPSDYAPLVSVIVPNFNHAPYLAQRLQSILDQRYQPLEIILLDDASDDGSAQILRDFADRHGATLIANPRNSGSPFAQWQRGLRVANGDLVWIAESDDWADPGFLERLVPLFANPAVTLAFGRTVFTDGENERARMEDQLDGLDPTLYDAPFLISDAEAVARGFAQANLVPNASAALIRRPRDLDLFAPESWREMRVCGDWMFYLHRLRGGALAYDPGAVAYYRIHDSNASLSAHGRDGFYREHAQVLATIARLYGPQDDSALRARLARLWRAARRDPVTELAALLPAPDATPAPPALRVMVAGAGFFAGGGETFAIDLANLLRAADVSVTFLDCHQEPPVAGIRARLSPDIPVVSDAAHAGDLVTAFAPDIVQSCQVWVDQAMLDAGARSNVVTLHGMYETLPEALRDRFTARLGLEASAVIATAPRHLDSMSGQIAREQLHRIDNAIITRPAPAAPRDQWGVGEDAFLITVITRAQPEKGWQEAIDAVTRARAQSGRDLQLLLVGTGPEADRLAAAPRPDWLHLGGYRSDVQAVLKASDLLLLPSRFHGESFPLILLEALFADTPVLASDIGEIGRMLSDGSQHAGETFALRDWQIDRDDLAARITALAEDPARLAALAAAAPALRARFTPERMVAAYLALYHQLREERDAQ